MRVTKTVSKSVTNTLRANGLHKRPKRTRFERLSDALGTFKIAVREDFELMRRGRAKYLGDSIGEKALPIEAVKRIGLQMMVAIRTMHLFRDAGLEVGAQAASRLIRYVYGAEIHPESRWEPGINLVHGNGLVVGKGATLRRGCVILHNVTLGDAFDVKTGHIGGPSLGEGVHIGPGCTLIGPINVGDGTKLMAGSVLDSSVPPRSLVRPPASIISRRTDRGDA
jgi:serine acetyltransferase